MNSRAMRNGHRWVRIPVVALLAVTVAMWIGSAAWAEQGGVRVAVEHLIVMPGQGGYLITDVISYNNPGAAIAPLHVTLPEGFYGLEFAAGTDAGKAVVTRTGFDDPDGLPAGQKTVVIKYTLPADHVGSVRIRKAIDYPITLLFVLLPKSMGIPSVSGADLRQGDDATIDNQQMSQFWTRDLASGAVFDVTLTLPSGATGDGSTGSSSSGPSVTEGLAKIPGTAMTGIWLVVSIGFGLVVLVLLARGIVYVAASRRAARAGGSAGVRVNGEEWSRLLFWQMDALIRGMVEADAAGELHVAEQEPVHARQKALADMLEHVDAALRNLGYEAGRSRVHT